MSPTEAPVDVDILRDEIRKTYTDVSTDAEQDFIFPTGRAWAEELGHEEIVRFLNTNLNEEKAANSKLNTVALRKGVNKKASTAA